MRLEPAIAERLAIHPHDLDLLRLEAHVLLRLRRRKEALPVLERVVSESGGHSNLMRAVALAAELKRWKDVVELTGSSATARPAPVVAMRIRALAALGETDALLPELDRLLEDRKRVERAPRVALFPSVLIPSIFDLHDMGKHRETQALLEKLSAAFPKWEQLREIFSGLYPDAATHAGVRPSAEAWTGKVDPEKLIAEAASRFVAGQTEEAIPLLEAALKTVPDSAPAWFNLGLARLKLEQWQEADAAFSHALALSAGLTDAWYNRGIARVHLKRWNDAVADLDHALSLRPELSQAWYYLWRAYQGMGDARKAAQAAQKYKASQTGK